MLPLKALLRLYRAHPWLLLMSLAGLMLGVTLVVAIELLNHSARTNFVAARSQLAGEATYRLAPHSKGDDTRPAAELAAQWARDPRARLAARLAPERRAAIDAFNARSPVIKKDPGKAAYTHAVFEASKK